MLQNEWTRTVLIFPTLLADDQRPNWKSAQGPHPVNIQLFSPFNS